MSKKPKTEDKKPPMKVESCTKDLLCDLTPTEINDAAVKASFRDAEHDQLEVDFAEVKTGWKKKIKDKNDERRRLQQMAREGKVVRNVACEMRYLWVEKRVDTVRLDTGEIFETRPMSAAELEMEFDYSGGNSGSKGDIDEEFAEN